MVGWPTKRKSHSRKFSSKKLRRAVSFLCSSICGSDLIKKYTVNESENSSNRSLEKLDPLKAIEIDNKLSGDDAESNSISELAAAIASLGGASPLPQDKM